MRTLSYPGFLFTLMALYSSCNNQAPPAGHATNNHPIPVGVGFGIGVGTEPPAAHPDGAAAPPPAAAPANPCQSFEAFKKILRPAPGFAGAYVIDGDILIRGEAAVRSLYHEECTPPIAHRAGLVINSTHAAAGARWSNAEKRNLSYCISNDFENKEYHNSKETVKKAMQAATASWEAVADVKFIYNAAEDANCDNKNIKVLMNVSPALALGGHDMLAIAFFPNQPRDERQIIIYTDNVQNMQSIPSAGILRHELGHVLGFRHEHIRNISNKQDPNCFDNGEIGDLEEETSYDPLSVMHYPQCSGGSMKWDLTLSQLDILGAQAVYGIPKGYKPIPFPAEKGTEKTVDYEMTLSKKLDYDHNSRTPVHLAVARVDGITAALETTVSIEFTIRSGMKAFVGYKSLSKRPGYPCLDIPSYYTPNENEKRFCSFKVERFRDIEIIVKGPLDTVDTTVPVKVTYTKWSEPAKQG